MTKRIFYLAFFLKTFISLGQASLVPADHQVYEWLHHQRVIGNIPEFEYETLPINRGRIENYLLKIAENPKESLSKIDQRQLESYLREFTLKNLKKQSSRTLFQGKNGSLRNTLIDKAKLFLGQDEFHLYSHVDSISSANLDIWWGQGYISNKTPGISDVSGGYNFLGLRTYGSLYGVFGYHLDYQNVSSLNSSSNLSFHPVWGDTWQIKRGNSSTFYAQAFASATLGKISLDLGRGALNYGTGGSPLVLSRQAPDFDWVRLSWKSKYVNYDYIHGLIQSLGTERNEEEFAGQPIFTRSREERWFVMRRLTVKPLHWLQLAYSQTTIYSGRGIDFSHLNPILPAEVAELNNQDLDNPSLYFDVVIRPYKFVELYAGISADDINKKSDIFRSTGNRSSEDGVFAYNIGANISYKSGTDLSIEYTQLDPYYYTHWLRFNTYENLGESLGSQLNPNSDQLSVKLRQWLPRRSWIELGYQKFRHGSNLTQEGVIINDVGGDLFEPQQSRDVVRFLAGELNEWNVSSIKGHIEPSRSIRLNFSYNTTRVGSGNNVPTSDYLELGISLGY